MLAAAHQQEARRDRTKDVRQTLSPHRPGEVRGTSDLATCCRFYSLDSVS